MIRLEYELRQRGLTQTDLARMTGVNRVRITKTINGYENSYLSQDDRKVIERALGWPHDGTLFQEVKVD